MGKTVTKSFKGKRKKKLAANNQINVRIFLEEKMALGLYSCT